MTPKILYASTLVASLFLFGKTPNESGYLTAVRAFQTPSPSSTKIKKVTPSRAGLTQDPKNPDEPPDKSKPPDGQIQPPDESKPPGGQTHPPDESKPPGGQTQPPDESKPPGGQIQPPDESKPRDNGTQSILWLALLIGGMLASFVGYRIYKWSFSPRPTLHASPDFGNSRIEKGRPAVAIDFQLCFDSDVVGSNCEIHSEEPQLIKFVGRENE